MQLELQLEAEEIFVSLRSMLISSIFEQNLNFSHWNELCYFDQKKSPTYVRSADEHLQKNKSLMFFLIKKGKKTDQW